MIQCRFYKWGWCNNGYHGTLVEPQCDAQRPHTDDLSGVFVQELRILIGWRMKSLCIVFSPLEIGEILPLASGGQCNVTQREKCQHYSSPDTHFDFSSCTNGKPIAEMTWERSKTLGCILKASMKIGLRCRRNRLGQQTTNGNARFWETGEAIVRKRFWETGEAILRKW